MNRAKISVVTPMYNSAGFIHKTLKHVFSSTYDNYEVILVDDGSTDHTVRVLETNGWMDRVRYIYKENRGISAARNTGILAATGHYISLLDHDDLPCPDKLTRLVAYLDNNPQYKMVYTPVFMEGEHVGDRERKKRDWILRYEGDLFETLFYRNHISPSSTLIERESILAAGLFDEGFMITEEAEFFLRYSTYFQIGYIDEPLTTYSWRYDNTSVRWKDHIPDYQMKIYEKYCDELKKRSPRASEIYRRSLGSVYRSKAAIEIQNGNLACALGFFISAIQTEPMRMKSYSKLLRGLFSGIRRHMFR
ncbi:MAG: glycosyltransferase family 2 protein [Thermodesulfobacteriota bacterium]